MISNPLVFSDQLTSLITYIRSMEYLQLAFYIWIQLLKSDISRQALSDIWRYVARKTAREFIFIQLASLDS